MPGASPADRFASLDASDDEDDELDLGDGPGILVVDDHQSNLVAIEAALAPLGWVRSTF